LQWSRAKFDDYFVTPATLVNNYLSEPDFVEGSLKNAGQAREQIETIVAYLNTDKPLTFEDCIVWARLQFEEKFGNEIKQLLHSFPKDATINDGRQLFWSGPKRAPDPLVFDPEDVCGICSS
jgi:ubiquitin-activating enzyme E1